MLSIWYMNQIFAAFSQYLNFTNILNNYVLLFLASFCICNWISYFCYYSFIQKVVGITINCSAIHSA